MTTIAMNRPLPIGFLIRSFFLFSADILPLCFIVIFFLVSFLSKIVDITQKATAQKRRRHNSVIRTKRSSSQKGNTPPYDANTAIMQLAATFQGPLALRRRVSPVLPNIQVMLILSQKPRIVNANIGFLRKLSIFVISARNIGSFSDKITSFGKK